MPQARTSRGASETYQRIQFQVPRPRLPRNPLEPLPFTRCSHRGLHRRHLSCHSTSRPVKRESALVQRNQHPSTNRRNSHPEHGSSPTWSSGSQARGPDPGEGGLPEKRRKQHESSRPHSLQQPERGRRGEKARRMLPPPPPLIGHCFHSPPCAPLCSALLCSQSQRREGLVEWG